MRRAALFTFIVPLLLTQPSAFAGPQPQAPPAAAATRADVLAGRATPEQAVDLLRAGLEAVGGTSVSPPPEPLGGYAYPVLPADLDGNGDDEALVESYVKGRLYYQGVDDRGVLWRERVPKRVWPIGFLTADFSTQDGEEVLFIGMRFDESQEAALALFGADGVLWHVKLPTRSFEVNGPVEADQDARAELGLTVWNADYDPALQTIDGDDGVTISSLTSTLHQTTGLGGEEIFVTDGPSEQPDEGVFVTRLGALTVAERRRLSDGQVTAREAVPLTDWFALSQGPDYTGDGHRDAFAADFERYGVFDGQTMELRWSKSLPQEDGPSAWPTPYPGGDVDGDGGQEVCMVIGSYTFEEDGLFTTASTGARCDRGANGDSLWEVSRQVAGQYAWASTLTGSDLDGDGLTDPVITTEVWECGEDTCTPVSEEVLAVSGKDASAIWSPGAPTHAGLAWELAESDLDGVTGHDAFVPGDQGGRGAPFSVVNGLTLATSWEGVVDTGDLDGYATWAIAADLDGDGSPEAVATATATEPSTPDCWGACPARHAFVAGFEVGGPRLWNFEL